MSPPINWRCVPRALLGTLHAFAFARTLHRMSSLDSFFRETAHFNSGLVNQASDNASWSDLR
jgi:hypothetical protein